MSNQPAELFELEADALSGYYIALVELSAGKPGSTSEGGPDKTH